MKMVAARGHCYKRLKNGCRVVGIGIRKNEQGLIKQLCVGAECPGDVYKLIVGVLKLNRYR